MAERQKPLAQMSYGSKKWNDKILDGAQSRVLARIVERPVTKVFLKQLHDAGEDSEGKAGCTRRKMRPLTSAPAGCREMFERIHHELWINCGG